MRRAILVTFLALALPATAHAETYHVGPARAITQLTDLPSLDPGDLVLVDGDATYDGGVVIEGEGVTVRGVPVAGRRPVIAGGTNTIEVRGTDHVLEALDITGGSFRCLYHHAADVVVRDTVVHDCPAHGILGADNDSGSLTLQRVEVHSSGAGTQHHQIYMATDENAHPGSVFRMEHSWVHDGTGGNNVKSRAERNEIVGNWIEGAVYHELELIGPDPGGGSVPAGVREDSDVVGNVLRKTGTFAVTRVGGDGTGDTDGRYRFAFNTILTQPGGGAVFRIFDGIDSLEMHGNVLHGDGGAAVNVVRDIESDWVAGRTIGGDRNWVTSGSANVPPEWTGTRVGTAPGFADAAALDLRPTAGSPLRDAGPATTSSPAGHPFPSPLHPPPWQPSRALAAFARPAVGALDIGAYEYGSPPGPPDDGGGPAPDDGGEPTAPGPDHGTDPDAGAGPGSGNEAGTGPSVRRRGRASVRRRGRTLIVRTGWTAACPAGGERCVVRLRALARRRVLGRTRVAVRPGRRRKLSLRLKTRPLPRRIRLEARLVRGDEVVVARRTIRLRTP
jgi:hypothetical protein